MRRYIIRLFVIAIFLITFSYFLLKIPSVSEALYVIKKHAEEFGMVKNIKIKGCENIKEDEVLKLMDINKGDKVYLLNAKLISSRLLSSNVIKDAVIKMSYNGEINVRIIEKKPFAILMHAKDFFLIDEECKMKVKLKNIEKYKHLPLVMGDGYDKNFNTLMSLLHNSPLKSRCNFFHYIGNRRWDIYLKDAVILKLPEQNISQALVIAEKFLKNKKYKDEVYILDLRLYPEKLYFTNKGN